MDFLNLIDDEETPETTEFDRQKFPPSINKFMDIINEYDSSIYRVAFILDGDTISKSRFSFTALVKDIINLSEISSKRRSILDDLTKFCEIQDCDYDISRLAMSEKIKKELKANQYTVLNVDMNEDEFTKDGKIIKYHKWTSYNKRKKTLNH